MLNIKTSTQSKTCCSGINSQSFFLLFSLKSLKIKNSCFRACLRVLHFALYKATTVESVTPNTFLKNRLPLVACCSDENRNSEAIELTSCLKEAQILRILSNSGLKTSIFQFWRPTLVESFLISSEFSILKVILAMLFLNVRF